MTLAPLHANYLWMRLLRARHPVQPHPQLTGHCDFGHAVVLLAIQSDIHPGQALISSRGAPRRPAQLWSDWSIYQESRALEISGSAGYFLVGTASPQFGRLQPAVALAKPGIRPSAGGARLFVW